MRPACSSRRTALAAGGPRPTSPDAPSRSGRRPASGSPSTPWPTAERAPRRPCSPTDPASSSPSRSRAPSGAGGGPSRAAGLTLVGRRRPSGARPAHPRSRTGPRGLLLRPGRAPLRGGAATARRPGARPRRHRDGRRRAGAAPGAGPSPLDASDTPPPARAPIAAPGRARRGGARSPRDAGGLVRCRHAARSRRPALRAPEGPRERSPTGPRAAPPRGALNQWRRARAARRSCRPPRRRRGGRVGLGPRRPRRRLGPAQRPAATRAWGPPSTAPPRAAR